MNSCRHLPAFDNTLAELATNLHRALTELGRDFHGRGWVLGTSGNFSAVVCRDPFRLIITGSGADKGRLTSTEFVQVNAEGTVTDGTGQPSAETALHLMVVRMFGAGAILHTHSIWSTIASEVYADHGGLRLQGYEMLKGLQGVTTHNHQEWLPIIENDQETERLASVVERTLKESPLAHGFLLRGHGLYTWGETIAHAKRHLEVFEFLLEVTGRTHAELAMNHSSESQRR